MVGEIFAEVGAPRKKKKKKERKNFVFETDPEQTRAGVNNPFRGPNPPHSDIVLVLVLRHTCNFGAALLVL